MQLNEKNIEIISAEEALELMYSGEKLQHVSIVGKLTICEKKIFKYDVQAEDCVFEFIDASNVRFDKELKFTNCRFILSEFSGAYFSSGLLLDNCIFENYLDFQSGGHNRIGSEVLFRNCTFMNYVNFFDCWFEGNVAMRDNQFHKGTNLLGIDLRTGIKVQFDFPPVIENNTGKLDLDNEGDVEAKSIYLR